MKTTIANLKIDESGVIEDFSLDVIPLSLLEMGCLPGQKVKLLQVAPLNDPLYIKVNGSHLAIRIEMAQQIRITRL